MTKARIIPILLLLASAACSDTADTTPGPEPAAQAAPAPDGPPSSRSPAPPTSAPTCGIDGGTALTGDGIGALRIGATVAAVRSECRILRDSVIPFREGTPERVQRVDLVRDTVEALVESDRIALLFVDSPAFRAADNLGVGSTIADLRATGPGSVSYEEGTHIQLRERCGLVFRPGPMRVRVRATLAELPADTSIKRVVVVGCGPTARYYQP